MLTSNLIRGVLFSMVVTAGVTRAGNVLGVDFNAGDRVNTVSGTTTCTYVATACVATSAEPPRELSMRPLAPYRIEPPDVLQIEITGSKAAEKTGCQSSGHSEQGALYGSVGTAAGGSTGAAFGTGTLGYVGSNAVVSGGPTPRSGSGTLTVTGTLNGNNSGTPTFGSPAYVVTSTFDNARPTNTGTVTMTWRARTAKDDMTTVVSQVPFAGREWLTSGYVTVAGKSPDAALTAKAEKTDSKVVRVPPANGQYLVCRTGLSIFASAAPSR